MTKEDVSQSALLAASIEVEHHLTHNGKVPPAALKTLRAALMAAEGSPSGADLHSMGERNQCDAAGEGTSREEQLLQVLHAALYHLRDPRSGSIRMAIDTIEAEIGTGGVLPPAAPAIPAARQSPVPATSMGPAPGNDTLASMKAILFSGRLVDTSMIHELYAVALAAASKREITVEMMSEAARTVGFDPVPGRLTRLAGVLNAMLATGAAGMDETHERQAFEAWYEGRALECGLEHSNWFRRDEDGDYKIADVLSSWHAWKASASHGR